MELVGGDGRPRREAWDVFGWLRLLLEEEGKMKRRGEEKKGGVYIRGEKIITILPSIQNKEMHKWRLASPFNEDRVWATKAGCGDCCCVQKGKRKIALKKRQKGMGDLIWVDFL